MKSKRKNPAAVALAKKSAKARMKSLTPKQRSEQARHAVQARWRKAKPDTYPQSQRWWVLFGFANDDPNHLIALCSSPDKNEVKQAARSPEYQDRCVFIDFVDGYDPAAFTMTCEFEPDVGAQVKALQTVLEDGTDEGGQP